MNTQAAREAFPCGLLQPPGSFRFSADALLLAEFAAGLDLPDNARVADLGTGCGVAGLGLLLRGLVQETIEGMNGGAGWKVAGVEREPALAEAARQNAALLGLEAFTVVTGDIANPETLAEARRTLGGGGSDQFDMVICNPPWKKADAGRTPPSPQRREALFGDAATLPLFFGAADTLLKSRGSLAAVCGASLLPEALAALPPRLRPTRLRFVHPDPASPAAFFLLEARKNSRAALTVEAPLALRP